MKLASLREGGRDGSLLVVDRSGSRAERAASVVPTLQRALEQWEGVAPRLEACYQALCADPGRGFALDPRRLAAPLPRCYQWLDASAYLSHVARVRKARGAELPPALLSDPLMYQGGGDGLLGPREPLPLIDADWGLDFEAEVGVITGDVPMGASAREAAPYIRLLVLINDVSLRNLIPAELAKGFGFLQGKPASALSPLAVTPDELGPSWDGRRLHLPLLTHLNGTCVGRPDAGQGMQFDFPTLLSHAARTRRLGAGTLLGSGTVSNEDEGLGCSCLVEKRVLEILHTGRASTDYLRVGDRVRISMSDAAGHAIFGAIEQEVIAWTA